MLNLIESEVDLCAGHDPHAGLFHGTEVVVAVAGDVVGFHVEQAVGEGILQLPVKLGIRVIAVHALLPAQRPRGRETTNDRMGERCYELMLQILQGIERLVDLPVCLVLLMDVGIAEGQKPGSGCWLIGVREQF